MLEDGVSRCAETRGVGGIKPVEDTWPTIGSLEVESRRVQRVWLRASYSVVKGSLTLCFDVI